MSREFDIIVVGAGASGLTAAIQAARKGASVLILEHMDRAGKKILVTGNGKCNFTNKKQGIAYYNGKNPAFVLPVFEQFGVPETLQFFENIGIYPKNKRDGYSPSRFWIMFRGEYLRPALRFAIRVFDSPSRSVLEKVFNHSVYVQYGHNRNPVRVLCYRLHIFRGNEDFLETHFNALGNALFAVGYGADFAR